MAETTWICHVFFSEKKTKNKFGYFRIKKKRNSVLEKKRI